MSRIETIGAATLYLGDCREILPTLPKVDAVVTDPPYGVGFQYESFDDSPEGHRSRAADWLASMRLTSDKVLVFCGVGNVHNWEKPDWIACWHKPFSVSHSLFGANNWEPVLAYGKMGRNERQSDWFDGTYENLGPIGHPCPKPIGAMKGALQIATKVGDLVADPFMGSGTTGVAAVKLGRKFIGIEIEPKYFDIACRRIEEATRQPDMFIERPPPPTQLSFT